MRTTVIVCTYNRCQSLATTLSSLAAQVLPESVEWEVLVVDNNSRDQTRDVVERFCRQYPVQFRYLLEPRPGKSHALNAGIREARGDVLAFTDDDVTAVPTWLQDLTAGLHGGPWAGAGGRTLPEQTFSPPAWLSLKGRYALAPLAIFDLGLEPRELNESPYGNNMAFRKAIFEKHGGFRTDLGPRAGSSEPQKSEDSEIGSRLLAAGERLRYEPAAVIYHSVPPSRVQKEYFLTWWFDKARADIRAFGIPPDTKWFVGGIPLYLFRRLAMGVVRWVFALEPGRRFDRKLKVWGKVGEIKECYRLSHAAKMKRECNA
jgi:glycosyltransferase involved in cell wall biosynthesis